MPIELKEESEGKLVLVRVSGKLTKGDYEHFLPEVEALIKKHGKIDVLMTMHDFHGFDAGALWQDIKFDLKHFTHIRRIAMVGETKWQKWMVSSAAPSLPRKSNISARTLQARRIFGFEACKVFS